MERLVGSGRLVSSFFASTSMKFKKVLALCAAFLPSFVRAADVFSLSTLQWSLRNQNGSIEVPGSLPSQVHLDLARAGIITEPLLGINGQSTSLFGPRAK